MIDLAAQLPPVLAGWLPKQRWFATKSAPLDAIRALPLATVRADDQTRVTAVVVEVDSASTTARYFVPVALHRETKPEQEHATIGEVDGWQVLDAAQDATTNAVWLDLMAGRCDVEGISAGCTGDLPPGSGWPLGAEQSNTSLVYDDVIVKLFRRLAPAPNPDLEVTLRLGELGSTCVAPALGWLEGSGSTLAIAQPFLRGAAEGWAMALASVRDLLGQPELAAGSAGGDFAPEAERLGAVVATLHAELRAAFGVERRPQLAAELAAQLRERLAAAVEHVPELAALAPRAASLLDALASLSGAVGAQRVHGDLHLGQVLLAHDGWVVLDFEGEPARPAGERVQPTSPLKDVAGMLRSFDYAAAYLLNQHESSSDLLAARSLEWASRGRAAFCAGYAAAAGRDPHEDDVLLRAFELDKVIYEVRYEADHRPDWVGIPLAGMARLLA